MIWAVGMTCTVFWISDATVQDFPEPVCPRMAKCRPKRLVGSRHTLSDGCVATDPTANPLDWNTANIVATSNDPSA